MEDSVPYCSRVVGLILTVHVLLATSAVRAEEECLTQKVNCYDCDSRTNPKCGDPFNSTGSKQDLPNVKECQGCCVKIVRMLGTPYESVWRTCTKNIEINLFMVDHVCMYESNKRGHMCFCEADKCNGAITRLPTSSMIIYCALILLLLLLQQHLQITTASLQQQQERSLLG